MPQGMQVWDASGNLVFDTANSLGRVLAVADISGSASGNVTNSNFTSTSRVFWTILPAATSGAGVADFDTPEVSYSSVNSRIEYVPGASTSGKTYKLIYGIW